MKITEISVDRPLAITMLILALVVLGLFSLPRLAVDLFPNMELPVAAIVTSYEGAAPAEVEKLVTKPIESAVATVSNVTELRSISQFGRSMVIVIFDWGTSVDNSVNDLRDKVEMIKGALPSDAGSPMTLKMDPNNMPIIMLSVEGKDLVRLKTVAEDTIQPRLERISGVASATINGGKEREIKVQLDRAKMESYGLSVTQVVQNIAGDNIAGTAGTVESGSSEMTIRVIGEYNTPESLKNIRISLSGTGNTIALGDIAAIEDSFKEETTYTSTNGEPSLGIYVMKASDGNTVQVARKVHEEVAELNKVLPAGMKIETVMDQSTFIQSSINGVTHHGLLGGIFAMIVLYFFLRNMRSTLVVMIVIPISIIATFAMLYFGKQTINMMSLGGLMLGLGSLVDFSVVVLESIYRYRQNGYGIIEAAKLGSAEVGSAVTASAMCQVLVFMPIVFVEGLAGILFKPLALTVSFSHIAALFAALTLVPMLSSKLLQNVPPPEVVFEGKSKNPAVHFGRFLHRLNERYGKLLRWALGHRKRVVGLVVLALVLSLAATPLIGTEFIPTMDQGEMTVSIKLPAGTKLEETKQVAENIEGLIRHEISDIDHIFASVGGGGAYSMSSGGAREASLQVKLKPLAERQITTTEAAEQLRRLLAKVPGAEITITTGSGMSMSTGSAVDISIRGDDLEVLEELGDQVLNIVKETAGTRNAANSLADANYELQVVVDREQAARYGLSAGQVLSAVRNSFDGQVVSRMRTGDNEVDIRLETAGGLTATQDSLANLTIVSPTGARVPVTSVAQIVTDKAPQQITRYTQNREVSITADIAGRDLGSINAEIQAKLDNLAVPEGYLLDFGGQASDMAESFGSLALALLLAIVLVYMFMVAQFESLFQPFIIMFALPPTFVGVVLGLGLTGHHLSVPALIGAIMLVGIVLNNSIVLVDYINTLRRRGYDLREAILEAGPVRLRPILMTALTTILALLPLAFGTGEGSEGQAPMAVVVAFGLALSTLITLVFVPVMYTIFDDWGKKISRRFSKKTDVQATLAE